MTPPANPQPTSTDDAERDEIARIARETLSRNGLMPDRWHRVADAILAAGFRRSPATPTTDDTVTMTEESVYDNKPGEFAKMVRDARSHPAPQPAREDEAVRYARDAAAYAAINDWNFDAINDAHAAGSDFGAWLRSALRCAFADGRSTALAFPPTAAAGVTEIEAAARALLPFLPESATNLDRPGIGAEVRGEMWQAVRRLSAALAAAQMRTGENKP